jgi:hypothetical protein
MNPFRILGFAAIVAFGAVSITLIGYGAVMVWGAFKLFQMCPHGCIATFGG